MVSENRSTWRFSHVRVLDFHTGGEVGRMKSHFGLGGFNAAA